MNKRTWEIIAEYASDEMGIKVVIADDCQGPQICLETKTITLPTRIKEENALAALSSLFHEAAHMKYSTIIPKDFSKDSIDHHILNAMEDVRIDNKTFMLLPNIWDFYLDFVKNHLCIKDNMDRIMQQDMLTRCLIQLILLSTNFGKYAWDKEAIDFLQDNHVYELFRNGVSYIDYKMWDDLRITIDKIKVIFNVNQPKEKLNDKGTGHGEEVQDCSGDRDTGDGSGKSKASDVKGKSPTRDTSDRTEDTPKEDTKIEDLIRPKTMWGEGEGLTGPSSQGFSAVELQANTKQKFINALNMSEKYMTSDGNNLNTDNLIAFLTGDIEELFHEEETEVVKKSKIIFCLDASGSMHAPLIGRKNRNKALAECTKSLTNLLDEIRETEGLNVDYDILAFNSSVHPLPKEGWENMYLRMGGGTRAVKAIQEAVNILNRGDFDGNRIIVFVTDGDVDNRELKEIKEILQRNSSEIKALILGIGASGEYVEKLCGDRNILCFDHAEQILMEAIQTMLGD